MLHIQHYDIYIYTYIVPDCSKAMANFATRNLFMSAGIVDSHGLSAKAGLLKASAL